MSVAATGDSLSATSARSGDEATLAEQLPIPAEARSKIRILVVDDERTLRESCASFLEAEGYAVSVCGKGDEAKRILKTQQFDVVLLDLYMGRVSGMELLQICLEANPTTLAVVMTGNPTITSSIEALRSGAWDYLPNLFQPRISRSLLEERRTRSSSAEKATNSSRNYRRNT